jgi:glycosyltransferase involved in cell wall biosynthesis
VGLSGGERQILYVFDGSSYLVRKNPEALVRAFVAAGLGAEGWRLVLKTKHLDEAGKGLRALVARSAGVELIDAPLPRPAMADLWAATDLYASPHRSEGFGLTVAEAMAKGLPVVATDYGGTRDFLDASCGWPVPARRQRLEVTDGHYLRGGTWGEPDEAAFAQALRGAADRITANDLSLGEAARARIAAKLSADAVGGIIRAAVAEVVARAQETAA